jgi:hypothetical protein
MSSTFRGVIDFFGDLGIYDVVLPFLLVFTVVFAILEKSRVFGFYKLDDKTEVTRKNLNAMVAFTMGFIAVASSKVVSIINEGLSNIIIVVISIMSFLLLAGSFFTDGKFLFDDDKYVGLRVGLVVVTLVVTVLIFLNAVKTDSGESWLGVFWKFVSKQWDSTLIGSIVLLGMIIGFMIFVTKGPRGDKPEKDKDKK